MTYNERYYIWTGSVLSARGWSTTESCVHYPQSRKKECLNNTLICGRSQELLRQTNLTTVIAASSVGRKPVQEQHILPADKLQKMK